MKPPRETISETLQLASAGEFKRALVLLDGAVRDAIIEGESVATLARHAGVLAERAGDLGTVRHYYEVAVEHDPDPWTYRWEMFAASLATTLLHAHITPLAG
jgi:Tfp pilus assembly protein PilF